MRENFGHLEKFRVLDGIFGTEKGDDFGLFVLGTKDGKKLQIMCGPSKEEWEHVSVSTTSRCPTWDEMSKIKSLFFKESECVIQYHPPKKDYVNNHPFCLHLWKYSGEIPMPPRILV